MEEFDTNSLEEEAADADSSDKMTGEEGTDSSIEGEASLGGWLGRRQTQAHGKGSV